MELLVHSVTQNAPYIHPSHDSILELWRTFPNDMHLYFLIKLTTVIIAADCVFNHNCDIYNKNDKVQNYHIVLVGFSVMY